MSRVLLCATMGHQVQRYRAVSCLVVGVAARLSYVTHISARDIKGVRVAQVCHAGAGLQSSHRWTTAELWSVGSGWPRESPGHARRSFSPCPSLRVPYTVRLPAERGVALGLRHVWQQACAPVALL